MFRPILPFVMSTLKNIFIEAVATYFTSLRKEYLLKETNEEKYVKDREGKLLRARRQRAIIFVSFNLI